MYTFIYLYNIYGGGRFLSHRGSGGLTPKARAVGMHISYMQSNVYIHTHIYIERGEGEREGGRELVRYIHMYTLYRVRCTRTVGSHRGLGGLYATVLLGHADGTRYRGEGLVYGLRKGLALETLGLTRETRA